MDFVSAALIPPFCAETIQHRAMRRPMADGQELPSAGFLRFVFGLVFLSPCGFNKFLASFLKKQSSKYCIFDPSKLDYPQSSCRYDASRQNALRDISRREGIGAMFNKPYVFKGLSWGRALRSRTANRTFARLLLCTTPVAFRPKETSWLLHSLAQSAALVKNFLPGRRLPEETRAVCGRLRRDGRRRISRPRSIRRTSCRAADRRSRGHTQSRPCPVARR